MKYAFMTFSCPELDLDAVLELATRTGYDGVEPRISAGHSHGIEVDIDAAARDAVRGAVTASGIALACIATSCRFADPATQQENVDHAGRAIDLAADLGCSTLRVFGGPIGAGLDRPQAIDLVATALSQLAGHAGERGVTLCMETHDDWCDPAHVVAVMERVGSAAVAATWDIMHPVRTKRATMAAAFEMLEPWIGHVHVHDAHVDDEGARLDFAPIGDGYVDHRTAIEKLGATGYGGYISGEWINWDDPWEVHLPRELQTMRGFER